MFSIVTGYVYAAFGYDKSNGTAVDPNQTLGYPAEGTNQRLPIQKSQYDAIIFDEICQCFWVIINSPDPVRDIQLTKLKSSKASVEKILSDYNLTASQKTKLNELKTKLSLELSDNNKTLDVSIGGNETFFLCEDKLTVSESDELMRQGYKCFHFDPTNSAHVIYVTAQNLRRAASTHAQCPNTRMLVAMALLLESMLDTNAPDESTDTLQDSFKILTTAIKNTEESTVRTRIQILRERVEEAYLKATLQYCYITHDHFSPDQMVQCSNCNNGFSREALKRWLCTGSDNCPICREDIFTSVIDKMEWTESDTVSRDNEITERIQEQIEEDGVFAQQFNNI